MKRFRIKGLSKEQRLLLEGIEISSVIEKSILEIGCGVGGFHHTLIKHGASSAFGVDISDGMINAAKQLSKELGIEGKSQYLVGDYLVLEPGIPPADILVMDKVVCCYENLNPLIEKSIKKTKNIYALSFPRPAWYINMIFSGIKLIAKALRGEFYPYIHDWTKMVADIKRHGFIERYKSSTFIWSVIVFQRLSGIDV
ncbi:MAG: class I SAM-dependent methyltransferase [Bacteroidota bacterium]